MTACPTRPPICSPTSIPPSARRSSPRAGRSASWPARGRARPGRSRVGWPTRSRPERWRRRHVLVVTFTDKAAGEMRERLAALGRPGVAAATFHAAALRQLRHFWPRATGRELPAILDSKVALLVDLARALPGGYRYVAVRDLAGEIEWAKARRVAPGAYEAGGRRRRPRRSPPRPAVRAALPTLRGGQGAVGPDRLRGHARADRPAHRGRRLDRPRGPRPLPLVQRRRVPGHERAPAGAPRRLARRAGGPGRRRRRGPDDLHVHRRVVASG